MGEQARGEALIARMDANLRDLAAKPAKRAVRVPDWGGGGFVPGRAGLFDTVLNAAGGAQYRHKSAITMWKA